MAKFLDIVNDVDQNELKFVWSHHLMSNPEEQPSKQGPTREGPKKVALDLRTHSGRDVNQLKKANPGSQEQGKVSANSGQGSIAPPPSPLDMRTPSGKDIAEKRKALNSRNASPPPAEPVTMRTPSGTDIGERAKNRQLMVIERPKKQPLTLLKPYMYTWDEVMALANEKYDFPCMTAKQLHFATINRFNYPGPVNRGATVPKPGEWRGSIIAGLNKLTPKTYFDVMDSLTAKHPDGSNPEFLKLLAQMLWEYGKEQTTYTVIFGDFVAGVKHQLNNDLQDRQRAAFCDTLLGCVNDFLTKEMKGSRHINGPRFVGFLAHNGMVELGTVMDALENLLKDPITNDDLESAGNMFLASGGDLLKKFGDRATDLANTLEALSRKKESFTGVVRWFIVDVLQRVRAGADVRTILGNNIIVNPKPADAPKPSSDLPHLRRGVNKFSVLGDDDDEEDEEIDESMDDPEELVKRYTFDHDVGNAMLETSEARERLMQAIALLSQNDANKAVGLLSELQDRGRFDPSAEEALEALKKTVVSCRDEEKMRPGCMRNCGLILAQLVIMGIVQADDFGEVFKEYRLDVVAAFLKKLCDVRSKVHSIRESSYWSEYKWRPEIMVSHLAIANAFSDDDEILNVFELYLYLLDISLLVKDCVKGENDATIEEVMSEVPPPIADSVSFAVGVMEILMESEAKSDIIEKFFTLLRPRTAEMLCWIEWYGWSTHEQPEQISERITNLCRCAGIDPSAYIDMKGTVIHDKVIAGVQRS